MEKKCSIKNLLESQGDAHEKVVNQSNSELPNSSQTQSPRLPRLQIDVQIAYDSVLDVLHMHGKQRR
jgi:hypothetical protein